MSGDEFTITPNIGHGLKLFFYSQLFVTPPKPTKSFANQTVIVTGSNSGLGLEAARHFYRLNAAKLILAVRTLDKGKIAKEDIIGSVKHRTDADSIEIWPVDLSSTESVLAFAERVEKDLTRVDVIVENAGVHNKTRIVAEGFEQMIQVNVINTLLMALTVLPKLRETKEKFPDSSPHITVVSSEAYRLTKFKEINAPDLYAKLNDDKEAFVGQARYEISKLLELLLVRELVSRLNTTKSSTPLVTINLVSPGLCKSNLDRSDKTPPLLMRIVRGILDRTTEVGARTYVLAACAGPDSHGELSSDGKNTVVEEWVASDVGKRVQKKVFEQTMKVLEARKPGVGAAVGV